MRGRRKCSTPAATKVTPRAVRARDIRSESTSVPRPADEPYLRTVTMNTDEPAPWRPESPAQRATNSVLPVALNVAVKRPPLAPAVTTCSFQDVDPTLRAETTI